MVIVFGSAHDTKKAQVSVSLENVFLISKTGRRPTESYGIRQAEFPASHIGQTSDGAKLSNNSETSKKNAKK